MVPGASKYSSPSEFSEVLRQAIIIYLEFVVNIIPHHCLQTVLYSTSATVGFEPE